METAELLSIYLSNRKVADTIINHIKLINKFDLDRPVNLKQIINHLDKLEATTKENIHSIVNGAETLDWLTSYRIDIEKWRKDAETCFAIELEQSLKERNISLTGHLPNLKAGFFSLQVDFKKWSVRVSYDTDEFLEAFVIDPKTISEGLVRIQGTLGSQLSGDEFITQLREIYHETVSANGEKRAPIISVYEQIQKKFEEQSKNGEHKLSSKKYRRADFSYDLFRIQHHPDRPTLVIAVMAYTAHKDDYLWVPYEPTGKGSTFSHLQF